MATTFYLIRHGESEANLADVFLGHGDLPLTAHGRQQAAMTAAYLKKSGISPDVIYSSDLSRAFETARCAAEQFGMPIIQNANLREIDAGAWDKLSFDELRKNYAESFGLWTTDIGLAQCDGGESVAQLQQRVVSALQEIAQNHENSVVFVFSHATPIRSFASYCMGQALEDLKSLPWPSNASVTKAVYDGGTFQLIDYSRDDFMGALVTKLPDDV